MVIKGAMNGESFLAYMEQCLVPTLRRGDIVVADNVSFHKVAATMTGTCCSAVPGRIDAQRLSGGLARFHWHRQKLRSPPVAKNQNLAL
jgi:hypothetical protein